MQISISARFQMLREERVIGSPRVAPSDVAIVSFLVFVIGSTIDLVVIVCFTYCLALSIVSHRRLFLYQYCPRLATYLEYHVSSIAR